MPPWRILLESSRVSEWYWIKYSQALLRLGCYGQDISNPDFIVSLYYSEVSSSSVRNVSGFEEDENKCCSMGHT